MKFSRESAVEAEWASECGQRGALTRVRCTWCERRLRPCNMRRHVDAAHFKQLTVDEVLIQVRIESGDLPGQAIDW